MFSTEGRFMAGLNYQNISQQVDMGPSLNPGPRTVVTIINPNPPVQYRYDYVYQPFQPVTMAHATATYVDYEREFSPAVELRVEGRTRSPAPSRSTQAGPAFGWTASRGRAA